MRQTRGHRLALKFTAVALLVVGSGFLSVPASAGSLSPGAIAMFPKGMGTLAYTDLKAARQYPWFLGFRDKLLPPHYGDFENFFVAAGIDPNTQVDELAWGQLRSNARRAGDEVLGIGFGAFDPASNEERFKQQKLRVIDYAGYHLYAIGATTGPSDILFTFLDSSMAAFGQRDVLEKLVDLRMGRGESLMTNDTLYPLISEANDGGVMWAVFDKTYTPRMVQQLIPEASLIPQAATLILRMHAMVINVDQSNSLDVRLQAVCGSVDDANLLGAVLQAGVMFRRSQQEQPHVDLAQEMLESMRVTPQGDRLQIESSLSDDQVIPLVKSASSPAVPM